MEISCRRGSHLVIGLLGRSFATVRTRIYRMLVVRLLTDGGPGFQAPAPRGMARATQYASAILEAPWSLRR